MRLEDGGSHYGRVSVYSEGKWLSVCGTAWDDGDAKVNIHLIVFVTRSFQFKYV